MDSHAKTNIDGPWASLVAAMELSNQATSGGFANPRRATHLGWGHGRRWIPGTHMTHDPEAMARAALALVSASMVTSGCQILICLVQKNMCVFQPMLKLEVASKEMVNLPT